MQQLKPPPVRKSLNNDTYVSNDLLTCTHVFVRHDAVRKPLQQPYDGPYKVLQRNDRHFTLQLKNRKEVISLDRIKPAFIDTDILPDTSATERPVSSELPPTTTVTRSGRHV